MVSPFAASTQVVPNGGKGRGLDMKDAFCVSSAAKQKLAYANFCDRASVQNI